MLPNLIGCLIARNIYKTDSNIGNWIVRFVWFLEKFNLNDYFDLKILETFHWFRTVDRMYIFRIRPRFSCGGLIACLHGIN